MTYDLDFQSVFTSSYGHDTDKKGQRSAASREWRQMDTADGITLPTKVISNKAVNQPT